MKKTMFGKILRMLCMAMAMLMLAGTFMEVGVSVTPAAANSIDIGSAYETVTANGEDGAEDAIETVMSKPISLLLKVVTWIGVAVLVFGGYQFAMSIMQDQPEMRIKGITVMAAGAIMIAIRLVLQFTGLVTFSSGSGD